MFRGGRYLYSLRLLVGSPPWCHNVANDVLVEAIPLGSLLASDERYVVVRCPLPGGKGSPSPLGPGVSLHNSGVLVVVVEHRVRRAVLGVPVL